MLGGCVDRRLRVLGYVSFASACLLALIFMFWSAMRPPEMVLVTDFINDWVAAHLARDGQLAMLFNEDDYNDVMRTLWGRAVEFHNWSYPPHLLPFLIPFAALSYWQGLVMWSLLGMLAFGWAIRPLGLSRGWWWLVLLAPACLVNLVSGQTGLFCAALLLGGLLRLETRPWLAGILFGLLTVKPQLGLLLVPVLLLRREWVAIAVAAATTALLVGFSILCWGMDPWIAFWNVTRVQQMQLLERFEGVFVFMMPGMFAGVRLLGASAATAWAVQAVTSALVFITVLRTVGKGALTPQALSVFALGTLLVTPYAFNYDMVLLGAPLAAYLAGRDRVGLFWGILWAVPVLVYPFGFVHMPLTPLFLLGALLALVGRSTVLREK